MILAATALAQIALGAIAGAGMAHSEISASIEIQSQVTCQVAVSGAVHPIGESVFASLGVADTPASLLLASNNKRSTLSSAIDTDDLSIAVMGSISNWPASGALTLDVAAGATDTSNEIVYYEGKSGQIITLVGRGKDGTSAKSFSAGSLVRLNVIAEHHNLLARTLIDVQTAILDQGIELDAKADAVHTHTPSDVTGLQAALDAKLSLTGGTLTGALILADDPVSDLQAATKRYVDYVGASTWNAKNNGCVGDGSTDDTAAIIALQNAVFAAGGGRIFFPKGEYIIGGAPIEPGGHNAQIPIPLLSQIDATITIEWVGEVAPPTTCSAQLRPTKLNHSIIKSTLTGASGNASMIGGRQISGIGSTNGTVWNARDMVFECPTNPTLTALDFSNQLGNKLENVLIHCGSLSENPPAFFEPTHQNAYGVKLSPTNHASRCDVTSLNVLNFYTGVRSGELAYGSLIVQACKIGLEIPFAYHPTKLNIAGFYGCQYNIKAAGDGPCGVLIDLLSLQNDIGYGQPWQTVVYDIDDASNLLHGKFNWTNVQAGVGIVHAIVKNGGANLIGSELW